MASVDEDLEAAVSDLSRTLKAEKSDPVCYTLKAPKLPTANCLRLRWVRASRCLCRKAILVDEAATNGPAIIDATKTARAHDYVNPLNGGAIGGGLPTALGVAVACPGRKVVHLQADGSGMYTVQALWTMAREQVDVTVIVLKNDAYSILDLEMARVREGEMNARMKAMTSLAGPTLDWVSISGGLGVPATRAATADEFHAQLEAALAAKGPRLIECQLPITKNGWRWRTTSTKNR